MTYTTVYKDYDAPTLEEAAAMMFRDPDIWRLSVKTPAPDEATLQGEQTGYAVDHWEWAENRLRVWFR